MEDNFHLGVKALIRNRLGEILLLKVNVKKLWKYKGKQYWDLPGGRIKKRSSIEKTLKREVKEEIGIGELINIKPFDMILSNIRIPVDKGTVGLILALYVCGIPTKKKILLSDEHIEFNWFSPKKASELLKVKYPKEFTNKVKNLK